MKTTIGIYGASGTTGVELAHLLSQHPQVEIRFCTSRQYAGQNLRDVDPAALSLVISDPNQLSDADAAVDVSFLCLPHSASAPMAAICAERSRLVIDLSGDLRLRDPAVHAAIYGTDRNQDLMQQTAYGLTEWNRSQIREAKVIANPGCYPTCSGLALAPLSRQRQIIGLPSITALSGVSGAGRKATATNHFCSVTDDIQPYKVGRSHRHTAEIEQILADVANSADNNPTQVIFTPHLTPMERGMLATITVACKNLDYSALRALFHSAYDQEPFVEVLPEGKHARIRAVARSNRAVISLHPVKDTDFFVICCAIDNLGKGAAGQAMQNMNLALGYEETMGFLL